MKLTAQLKAWLVEHMGVAKDADDSAFRKAVAEALVDGKLDSGTLLKLTEEPQHKEADAFAAKLDAILESQKSFGERLAAVEQRKEQPAEKRAEAEEPQPKGAPELQAKDGGRSLFELTFASAPKSDLVVRHVTADKRYDGSRGEKRFPAFDDRGRRHPYANQRFFEGAPGGQMRLIDEPSELDRAVAGAYCKWSLSSQLGNRVPTALRMTDHDAELMQFALREMKWAGVIHGVGDEDSRAVPVFGQRLDERQVKAVLDDATSGGLELAPIVFDDMIISTPILNGELYPLVNVVNITRGRRVEGGVIGNVTLSSGGADGTAIPLFATASFISAFDTTIFVANGAIEIGLDFLSDSPVAVADIVTAQYGQVLLNWLDTQIAIGDGTTEPEGVTVASGTVTVNATNGATGPPTVGDYEALLFGVAKQYKTGYPVQRIAYAANETTYRRARAIAVSGTDQRRVFGMTHEDYTLLGHPYKINGSFGNRSAVFGNFARYRMYRRMGLTMKATTEGKELTRANLLLITARARFGGQIEDGNAFAVQADGQS